MLGSVCISVFFYSMKRKVVKHGSATLTISLPSRWVKKYGIKSGDELEIVEDKGNLVVVTSRDVKSVREAHISLDDYGSMSGRAIRALFKGGVDMVRVSYNHPTRLSEIETNLVELIGFEIMQQSANGCTLQEVSGFSDQTELGPVINRTFMVLISIVDDFADCVKGNDKDLLQSIVQRDATINKFANHCRRLINKKGLNKIKDVPMVYYIVEELENLGDEYKYLAKYILDEKVKLSNKEILQIIEMLNKLVKQFVSLYSKFTPDKAKDFGEENGKLRARINKAMKTTSAQETRIFSYLSNIATIINNMVGPLLTMKLPELCENKI